jgi:membrane associated rhomboid family serine protease
MVLLMVLGAMWAVEIFDRFVLGNVLERQGILPRTLGGLDGILWAPLLHGSFPHLVSNTVPFVVLGGLVLLRGFRRWLMVTLYVTLLAGLAVWLFARSSIHIGASIVIFGYLGYLLVAGFVERNPIGIAIGLAVGVVFGTTILTGILPIHQGISWEGHLFGLLAGVTAAYGFKGDAPDSR